MADITLDFPVRGSIREVYARFATPEGLNAWWTLEARGRSALGEPWCLDFGPGYEWRALVTACEPPRLFELTITDAMDDWRGTRVRALLRDGDGDGAADGDGQDDAVTTVHFCHEGWPEASDHYRVSTFCWAMYLRHLRRHVESGIFVPYAERLDA